MFKSINIQMKLYHIFQGAFEEVLIGCLESYDFVSATVTLTLRK